MLDGWDLRGQHNVLNGLAWGLDGWLYGCSGNLSNSRVGKPGTPANERLFLSAGIWRYHPVRRQFEVVAHGTTNPWGIDYNAQGHIFFSSSVTPHLYHAIQGAHYVRMFGHDFDPYVYGQIKSIVDHLHWAGGDWTSWTTSRGGQGANAVAGGGHSHCGLMIYQGEGFPDGYRGTPFLANIHGNRINNDILHRSGSGYVCSHRPDFLFMNDRMSMGTSLHYGPDGGVYYTDWYDGDECHTHQVDVDVDVRGEDEREQPGQRGGAKDHYLPLNRMRTPMFTSLGDPIVVGSVPTKYSVLNTFCAPKKTST